MMGTLSDLCAFSCVTALCMVLCHHPAHAATVKGGRSTVGSPSVASDIRVIHDSPYGPLPDQKMDVYTKGKLSGAPVIFMVHGGGWVIGGKDSDRVVDNKVARWVPEGFVFISINYPMIPDADVTMQAKNVAMAIATAQQHAGEWGGDPAKFILMGHSAGAHLVSLINANPDAAYKEGAKPWIGTISLDSAAMNVVTLMQSRHMKLYDNAFGLDPEVWKALSPYYVITSKAGPWLNVCSTQRDTSCSQSQAMADRAATLGVKAALHKENLSHREINENLGLPGDYTMAVESFMATLDPAVAERLAHPPAGQSAVPDEGRKGLLERWREHRAARGGN